MKLTTREVIQDETPGRDNPRPVLEGPRMTAVLCRPKQGGPGLLDGHRNLTVGIGLGRRSPGLLECHRGDVAVCRVGSGRRAPTLGSSVHSGHGRGLPGRPCGKGAGMAPVGTTQKRLEVTRTTEMTFRGHVFVSCFHADVTSVQFCSQSRGSTGWKGRGSWSTQSLETAVPDPFGPEHGHHWGRLCHSIFSQFQGPPWAAYQLGDDSVP